MKRYSIIGLALFVLAIGIFSMLTITWQKGMNKFFVQSENKAFALQLSDCVCCHGSTVDRHHRLAANQAFPCTKCHEILYDPTTQTYTPQLIRDCTVCHTIDVALLDRHHVKAYQASCFTCHQMLFDEATQLWYITLLEQCTIVTPPPVGQNHYVLHRVTLNDCTSCHLDNLFDQHGERCDLCHKSVDPAVQTAIQTKNTQCTACHSQFTHSAQCKICHTSQDPKDNKLATIHQRHMAYVSCGVCHKIPETTNLEPTGQYCTLCHGSPRSYDLSVLPEIHRTHMMKRAYFPYACYMCHGQAVPQTQPKQCIPCHDNKTYNSSDLGEVHYLHNRLFDCSNCHHNPRLFAVDPTNPCLRCHEARPYTSVYWLHAQHLGKQCWSCHPSENVSAKAGTTCVSCHGSAVTYKSSTDLHHLHDSEGYQCWVCHDQLIPMYATTCSPINSAGKGSITGAVTDSNGAALNEAVVLSKPGGYLARTASDGTYALCVASEIAYTLTAYKTGYAEVAKQNVTVPDGQTITMNFSLPASPPGTITGKVTARGSGFAGATISTDIGGYTTTTAKDGSYTLSVRPGTYTVTASAKGYANDSMVVTVSPDQIVTLNITLTTTTAKGMITGTVTEDTGLLAFIALPGVTISTDIGGYTTTTASDGTYSLAVNPGTYVVTAHKAGYASKSTVAAVSSNQTVTANMTLTHMPPGTISGKVSGSGGIDISGATVSTNTGGYTTTTAADGTYLLAVNAGTYTVTASMSGYTSNSTSVTVASTQIVTANFTLAAAPAGGKISGKVTDTKGTAVSGAAISTNTGGYTTTTAADGTYTLTVNPGTYTVTASKINYSSSSRTVTVQSNQTVSLNFALPAKIK